jgi:hypothetical protein
MVGSIEPIIGILMAVGASAGVVIQRRISSVAVLTGFIADVGEGYDLPGGGVTVAAQARAGIVLQRDSIGDVEALYNDRDVSKVAGITFHRLGVVEIDRAPGVNIVAIDALAIKVIWIGVGKCDTIRKRAHRENHLR